MRHFIKKATRLEAFKFFSFVIFPVGTTLYLMTEYGYQRTMANNELVSFTPEDQYIKKLVQKNKQERAKATFDIIRNLPEVDREDKVVQLPTLSSSQE